MLHPEVVETSPKLHAGPARQDFLHFLRNLSAELTCGSSIVFDEGSDRGDLWEIDPPLDRRVGTERPLVAGTDFEGRFAHGSSHNVLQRRLLRPNLAKPRCFRVSTVPPRPLHPLGPPWHEKGGRFPLRSPDRRGPSNRTSFQLDGCFLSIRNLKGNELQENRRYFLDVVGPRPKRRMWTHICAHKPSKCSPNSPWRHPATLATPTKRPRCECEEERNGSRCP